MGFRAVLIPLCVLFTQAACYPAGSKEEEAPKENINMALKMIGTAWGHLDDSLPNVSCSFLNGTEPMGLKQQPLAAHRLSTVLCYLQELSNLTTEVQDILMIAAQFIKAAEQRLSNSTSPQNCSLPGRKEAPDDYVYVKCFLELVVLEGRPNRSNLMKS